MNNSLKVHGICPLNELVNSSLHLDDFMQYFAIFSNLDSAARFFTIFTNMNMFGIFEIIKMWTNTFLTFLIEPIFR